MPPKSTKTKEPEVKLDEKAQAQLDESNRLQQLAFDRGVSHNTPVRSQNRLKLTEGDVQNDY